MATVTYHDRYIGESGTATKFSRRHYWVIAGILRDSKASLGIVEAFITELELDNPRFDADLFRKAST